MSRLRFGIKSLACTGTILATVLAAVLATVMIAGCAASPGEVRTAQAAAYDTDFAVIFNHTLAVVRSLYGTVQENPAKGIIRTSWHEVRLGNTDSDNPYQRDFVRFDLYVDGPRPWRVRVRAQAARWDFENAMPAALEGGDEPPWLQGRIEGLQVAIHQRLADHAVAGPGASARGAAAPPAEDPRRFGDIPPAAARAVARVLAALEARDQEALGATMHPAFLWNLGAPPSARDAQVMWRADGTRLDALKAVIAAGCRTIAGNGEGNGGSVGAGAAGTRITCPPASAAPGFAGPRATFAPGPDGTWTMRSFLTEE